MRVLRGDRAHEVDAAVKRNEPTRLKTNGQLLASYPDVEQLPPTHAPMLPSRQPSQNAIDRSTERFDVHNTYKPSLDDRAPVIAWGRRESRVCAAETGRASAYGSIRPRRIA